MKVNRRMEQKIWLTAYLTALRRHAPAKAEAWANNAVERFRRRQRIVQALPRRRLPDITLTDDPEVLARFLAETQFLARRSDDAPL